METDLSLEHKLGKQKELTKKERFSKITRM